MIDAEAVRTEAGQVQAEQDDDAPRPKSPLPDPSDKVSSSGIKFYRFIAAKSQGERRLRCAQRVNRKNRDRSLWTPGDGELKEFARNT